MESLFDSEYVSLLFPSTQNLQAEEKYANLLGTLSKSEFCKLPDATHVTSHFLLVILLMAEILHQLIGSLSHYLKGFIYARQWLFGMSSTNNSTNWGPNLFDQSRCCRLRLRTGRGVGKGIHGPARLYMVKLARDLTRAKPQKVANWKGHGTPYFRNIQVCEIL